VVTYNTTPPDVQFQALADATRRAILARLVDDGPLAVGELAREFPVSRPAISQHLRVLKDAGLVVDTAAGARRLYAINPAAIASLHKYFERFWTRSLGTFKKRVEVKHAKEER
jgi:DNA-binding transcriptional ArsR family regulator